MSTPTRGSSAAATLTRYQIFKGRPEWRNTIPAFPWTVLAHRRDEEDPRNLGTCPSHAEAVAMMVVDACREQYVNLLHTGDGTQQARQRLFDALMHRFELQLTRRGIGPPTPPELYALRIPCADCLQTVSPDLDYRHEIVYDGRRAPHARCDRQHA